MKTEELCLRLEAGALRSFDSDESLTLTSCEGVAWVTQEGDERDYVLHAGESVTIRGKRLVVIEALQPARLKLMIPWNRIGIRGGKPAFAPQ
jgi:hypothetical protein